MRRRLATAFALALLVSASGVPVHGGGPGGSADKGFLREGKAGAEIGAAAAPIEGFTDSVIYSDVSGPTVVRFAPDGRVLIAEKRGRILIAPSIGQPAEYTLDIRTRVNSYWDRGLLGFVLDPDFELNGNVYVAYTYDHILGDAEAAPKWLDGCPSPPGPLTDGCVVSARVSRFTLTGTSTFGPEEVLVEDWCMQFPSHSIGDLEFGDDGWLYASGGDGASFNDADWGQFGGSTDSPTPANPCGDPPGGLGVANTSPSGRGGALRSQSLRRPGGEPVSLDGTIIRIDPATGDAAPGNPLAGHANPNARRIVASGFRNPFRIAFRPGTNELWIGDVGWSDTEEINRLTNPGSAPVENFGWPCYEGFAEHAGYSGLTLCDNLYDDTTAAIREPRFAYAHGGAVVPGDGCPTINSAVISGLAFYEGGSYPARFDDALFFTDHSRNCIWAMRATNGIPDPSKIEVVVREAGNPVDLQAGPGGDIFYVDHEGGQIHRLTFAAGNTPPVAQIAANPVSGDAPMEVEFDGRTSADSNPGDTLTYAWDFTNNGSVDATTPTATFEYATPAVYTARLTVTDQHGASGTTTQQIVANGSGPTIATPPSSLTWAVGDEISFSGSATDGEGDPLPASALSWTLTILHCATASSCHPHVVETRDGVSSGTFDAPDHSYPSSLEIRLTASDDGVETSATVLPGAEGGDPQVPLGAEPARLQDQRGNRARRRRHAGGHPDVHRRLTHRAGRALAAGEGGHRVHVRRVERWVRRRNPNDHGPGVGLAEPAPGRVSRDLGRPVHHAVRQPLVEWRVDRVEGRRTERGGRQEGVRRQGPRRSAGEAGEAGLRRAGLVVPIQVRHSPDRLRTRRADGRQHRDDQVHDASARGRRQGDERGLDHERHARCEPGQRPGDHRRPARLTAAGGRPTPC